MRFLCSISLTHSFLTLGAFFPLPLDIEEVSIMRSGSATRERERETFDQIHFHKFRTPGHGKILYGMEKISKAKRSKKCVYLLENVSSKWTNRDLPFGPHLKEGASCIIPYVHEHLLSPEQFFPWFLPCPCQITGRSGDGSVCLTLSSLFFLLSLTHTLALISASSSAKGIDLTPRREAPDDRPVSLCWCKQVPAIASSNEKPFTKGGLNFGYFPAISLRRLFKGTLFKKGGRAHTHMRPNAAALGFIG